MPQLSGKFSQYLNIGMAAVFVVGAMGPHAFPDYVPAWLATGICQSALWAGAVIAGINAYLHNAGGPGVAPAGALGQLIASNTATTVKSLALLAALMLGLLALGGPTPARAATLTATSDPLSLFITGLTNAIKTGTTSLLADLQAADTDAIAHNDTISDPCYKAEISFVQGIPSLASPAGPIGPIQLFQIKRDVQNAFAGGIPNSLKIACGPLWLDETGAFAKFTAALAAVGIVIAK